MSAEPSSLTPTNLRSEIRNWLRAYVAQLSGISAQVIADDVEFDALGLDSTAAAGLSGDLSDWLGIHLEANIVKQHRTIGQLADRVFQLAAAAPRH